MRERVIDYSRLAHLQEDSLVDPLQMPGVDIIRTFGNVKNADVQVWQSRVPAGEHYFPPCNKFMLSVCLSDVPHGVWYHGGITLAGRLQVDDLLVKGIGSSAYHCSDFASDFFHLGFSTSYLQAVASLERKTKKLDFGEFLGLKDITLNSLIATLRPDRNNALEISPSYIDIIGQAVCLHLKQKHQQSHPSTKGLSDVAYDAVNAYLRNRTDRHTSVADVAQSIGMEATLLSRLFKQRTGHTLGEFGLHMRLAQACEMFQKKNISATQVAMATGFADLPHFSRHFKKRYGMSPSALSKH